MKAYEKIEKRLAELGLLDEWLDMGECGRLATTTEDGISIFGYEGDGDGYAEFQFPPIHVMQRNEEFRMRALHDFCQHPDDAFVAKLARWVADIRNECPLYPLDVFFLWDSPVIIDFEDDEEEEEEKPAYKSEETTEEWCPHCDECVELQGEFKVQRCPNCGKWIVPCSLCPFEDCVKKCPLERLATILNAQD